MEQYLQSPNEFKSTNLKKKKNRMKNLVFWYFDEQWFAEKEPYKNITDDYRRTKRKKK